MKKVTFEASAKAESVDQNALKKAIDQGQKVIEPLKVEDFNSAFLELSNDKIEIRFTIESEPEKPVEPPLDPQALSDEVEGAE